MAVPLDTARSVRLSDVSADHAIRLTLTDEEAAEVLGIGRTLAFEMARRGELPTLRLGRRLVVPRPALMRMLAGEPTAEQPTADAP